MKAVIILNFKKKFFLLLFLGIVINFSVFAQSQNRTIRIKFSTTQSTQLSALENKQVQRTKSGYVQTGISNFDALSAKHQVVTMKRVFRPAGKFEARHKKYGLDLWYDIDFSATSETSIKNKLNDLKSLKELQAVEEVNEKTLFDAALEDQPAGITYAPNDPNFSLQWNFYNTGQTGGTRGCDIHLADAWNIQKGSKDVIVAVIDAGVDINHSDLKNSLWINEVEYKGKPGVDDDKNGYIDDINGYNFADDNGTIIGDNHGTHVAGVIGAVNNNGTGVCGVAGGSESSGGVRIMSCSVFGSESDGGFADAFIYAADMGAVIANNSWGYKLSGNYEQSVLDAINYFIANAGKDDNGNQTGPMAGGIVIFAAGNNGSDNNWYPACYSKVLSVAAVNHKNCKSYYSNYGSWVDIAAPGGETNVSVNQGIYSLFSGNTYGYMQGTSMACPHVSGIAALIISEYKDKHIKPEFVWDRLINRSDNIDLLNPLFIGKLGKGIVNANSAITHSDTIPPSPVKDLRSINSTTSSVALTWSATGGSNISGKAFKYEIRVADLMLTPENFEQALVINNSLIPKKAGEQETFEVTGLKPETKYYFAIKVIDLDGFESEISNVLSVETAKAPHITISPDSLFTALNEGDSIIKKLTIDNTGGHEQLNYTVSLRFLPKTELKQQQKSEITSLNTISSPADSPEIMSNAPTMTNVETRTIPYFDGFELGTLSGWTIDTFAGTKQVTSLNSATGSYSFYCKSASDYKHYSGIHQEFSDTAQPAYMSFNVRTGSTAASAGYFMVSCNGRDIILFYAKSNGCFSINNNVGGDNSFPYEAGKWYFVEIKNINWQTKVFDYYVDGKLIKSNISMRYAEYASYVSAVYLYNYDRESEAWWDNIKLGGQEQTWLRTNTVNGTIPAGTRQDIVFYFNADTLTYGIYNADILINSNDPERPELTIPAHLRIKGTPVLQVSTDTLKFGQNFVNKPDTLLLSISNKGNEILEFDTIYTNNPHFGIVNVPKILDYGKTTTIKVWYHSIVKQVDKALLTIISSDKANSPLNIQMEGESLYPPKITVTPDSLSDNINVGEVHTKSVTLKNEGDIPLNFSLNQINYIESDKSAKYESLFVNNENTNDSASLLPKDLSGTYNSGYKWSDSDQPGGPVFNWVDISSTGTIITGLGDDNFIGPLPLSFEFPYFENKYKSFYIQSNGVINFTNSYITLSNQRIPVKDSYNNLIAWCWCDLYAKGSVYYKDFGNMVVIQFKNYGQCGTSGTINAQIILYSTGKIILQYLNYTNDFRANSCTIGIENTTGSEGIQTVYNSSYIHNNLAVRYSTNDWLQIDTTKGIINPGQSKNLNFTIDAKDMIGGSYDASVSIISNDPVHSLLNVPVHIEVKGVPNLKLSRDTVLFQDTYSGYSDSITVSVINQGSDNLIVDSLFSTNHHFVVTPVSFNLKPNQSKEVKMIYYTSEVQKDTGLVYLFSNDTAHARTVIYISGQSMYPPEIEVFPDTLSETLLINQVKQQSFTISNLGKGNLFIDIPAVSLAKTEIVKSNLTVSNADSSFMLADLPADSLDKLPQHGGPYYTTPDTFDYKWSASNNPNGPVFAWEDITSTGTLITGLSDDNVAGSYYIGFTFPFFRNNYNYFYIQANGIIGFTYPGSTYENQPIPTRGGENNFIAWCWDDLALNSGSVYYKSSAEKLIIQFKNYGEHRASGIINAEVIIYPNGKIILQYLNTSNGFQTNDNTIGIESYDGTDGVQVAFNSSFIQNNLAVEFVRAYDWLKIDSPVRDTLLPGTSKAYNAGFDARGLYGGTYKLNLDIKSNDPANPIMKYPINLHVIGDPKIKASKDSILYGKHYTGYSDTLTAFIKSIGTDLLIIDTIYSDNRHFGVVPGQMRINYGDSSLLKIWYHPDEIQIDRGSIFIKSNDSLHSVIKINLAGESVLPPVLSLTPDSFKIQLNAGDSLTKDFFISNKNGHDSLTYLMYMVNFKNSDFSKNQTFGMVTNESQIVENLSPYPNSQHIELAAVEKKLPYYEGFEEGNLNNWYTNSSYGLKEVVSSTSARGKYSLSINNNYGSGSSYGIYQTFNDELPKNIGFYSKTSSISYSYSGNFSLVNGRYTFISFYFSYPGKFYINGYKLGICESNTWYYIEFRNIDWVTRTFDFYVDGTLILSSIMLYNPPVAGTYNIKLYSDSYGAEAWWDEINLDYGPSWLSANKKSGTIAAGDSQKINLKFNARDLIAGTYKANILVNSNDPARLFDTVPVVMKVNGTPKIELSRDSVIFNQIYKGYSDSASFVIRNKGTDTLKIEGLFYNNKDYFIKVQKLVIPCFDSTFVGIKYEPSTAAVDSCKISILSNDTTQPLKIVYIRGLAIEPPSISVNPEAINVEIYSGKVKNENITIRNNGGSSLDFKVDEFAESYIRMGLDDNIISTDSKESSGGILSSESPTLKGSEILVIQDKKANGIYMSNYILQKFGIAPVTITSADLLITEFSNYKVIIITGSQYNYYYTNIQNCRVKFESFVRNGGVLQYQLGVEGAIGSMLLVDSVSLKNVSTDYYNTILLPADSIFKGITSSEIYNPTNSPYFDTLTLPENCEILTVTRNDSLPTTIRYNYGLGKVIASSISWEYLYYNNYSSSVILQNLTKYSLSRGRLGWLRTDSSKYTLPSNAKLNIPLTIDATVAGAGDYKASIVFTSNDPAAPVKSIPVFMHVIGFNAPDVLKIPVQTIEEGGLFDSINLDNCVFDKETPDSLITWKVLGENDLKVSIVKRVAHVSTPSTHWAGVDTIRFVATDNDTVNPLSDSTDVIFRVLDLPVCFDEVFTEMSGHVTENSGSENYSNFMDCQKLIQPPNAKNLTLVFNSFNTESGYDILRVYDGNSNTDPIIGEFSGKQLPPKLSSHSGSMLLQFTTDSSNVYSGWSAYYMANYDCNEMTSTFGMVQEEACNEFISPSGKYKWTSSGTYQDTIPNTLGCDSIITFSLTIRNLNLNVTGNGLNLISEDREAGHQWIDCKNEHTPIFGETGMSFNVQKEGEYAVIVFNNSCIDTSECIMVKQTDIPEIENMGNISVFPNPTKGHFTINLGGINLETDITITEIDGRIIEKKRIINTDQVEFDLEAPAGIYLLYINTLKEKIVFKIIKN